MTLQTEGKKLSMEKMVFILTWISSSAICCWSSATAAILSASLSLTAITSSLFYKKKIENEEKMTTKRWPVDLHCTENYHFSPSSFNSYYSISTDYNFKIFNRMNAACILRILKV